MGLRNKLCPTRCELDPKTDSDFTAWADNEGRSKRRHISILVRKLVSLQKDQPDALIALGLLNADAQPAGVRR